MISVTVKWDKRTFSDVQVNSATSGAELKQVLFALTKVPPDRQKVMCKGGWAGLLKSDTPLSKLTTQSIVSLIGSAEEYVDKEVKEPEATPVVVEAFVQGEGQINAIQKIPSERKEESNYTSVVKGLSQSMLENEIKQRKASKQPELLLGKPVMRLGLELDRSYLTALVCLDDGTLVSGAENGHVQLWRHARRLRDVIHVGMGGAGSGVVGLAKVPANNEFGCAFASSGNASVELWNEEGDHVHTLLAPSGATPIADGLACWSASETLFLASALRPSSGPQPRIMLAPTNPQEAKQIAQANAQADMIDMMNRRWRLSVQVWALQGRSMQQRLLAGPYPVNAIAHTEPFLVIGDDCGGLRFWRTANSINSWACEQQITLVPPQGSASILCLQPLSSELIAVSTKEGGSLATTEPGMTSLRVPVGTGVFIVDFTRATVLAVLTGHIGEVRCMCRAPNGGLFTGGGKNDGTIQFWMPSLWTTSTTATTTATTTTSVIKEATSKLTDPGYCFALTTVPDLDHPQTIYALAAARYNAIAVVL